MWPKIKFAGVAILALVVLIVVLQNTESVDTHILFWAFPLPQAALLFGTLVVGFVVGLFTAGKLVGRKKKKEE